MLILQSFSQQRLLRGLEAVWNLTTLVFHIYLFLLLNYCYSGFLFFSVFILFTCEDGEMGSRPSASVLTFDLLVVSGLTVLLTAGSPLAL